MSSTPSSGAAKARPCARKKGVASLQQQMGVGLANIHKYSHFRTNPGDCFGERAALFGESQNEDLMVERHVKAAR